MLKVIPISLKQSKEFIVQHHRHHKPQQGHKFSIGVIDETEKLRGVAIAGRPVSRMLDDGLTLEVTRVCTDGVKNGCSILYGRMRRIAKEMGFRHIITYILSSEDGTSLKASGWQKERETDGGSWSRELRLRVDGHPLDKKERWGCYLG
jgi:hypothetical protein